MTNTYIDLMVERYSDGDVTLAEYPPVWNHTPSDGSLQRDWEPVMSQKPQALTELVKRYGSLFAFLLAVKYRPEVAAVMLSLLGGCLIFPTKDMYRHLQRVLCIPRADPQARYHLQPKLH